MSFQFLESRRLKCSFKFGLCVVVENIITGTEHPFYLTIVPGDEFADKDTLGANQGCEEGTDLGKGYPDGEIEMVA